MAATDSDQDPFRDPSLASAALQPLQPTDVGGEHAHVPDTLAVGRNASLTLGTDSLIVLGMDTDALQESVR
jgi:sphingosine kinase